MKVLTYIFHRLPPLIFNGILSHKWFMLKFSVLATCTALVLPLGLMALGGNSDGKHVIDFIMAKKVAETISESLVLLYAPLILIYLKSVSDNKLRPTISGFFGSVSNKRKLNFILFCLLIIVLFVALQAIAFNVFGFSEKDSINSADQGERIGAYGANYFRILKRFMWTILAAIMCFRHLDIKLNKENIRKYAKTYLTSLIVIFFTYYAYTGFAILADSLIADFIRIFPFSNDVNDVVYYSTIAAVVKIFISLLFLGYCTPIFGAIMYYPVEYIFTKKQDKHAAEAQLPNYPDIE